MRSTSSLRAALPCGLPRRMRTTPLPHNQCRFHGQCAFQLPKPPRGRATKSPPPPAASTKQTTTPANPPAALWDTSADASHLGPAAQAALASLEWERLTAYVSRFAQTALGQRACAGLLPATDPVGCNALLAETRAAEALEAEYAAELDFGGVQTAQAAEALARASRGGLLSGPALHAVSSLLAGAAKLQRSIASAAREARATGNTALDPLTAVFDRLETLPQLGASIAFAVRDDGTVRENASDEVKRAAARVRTIEGRLRNLLGGRAGEVSEHGGRLCLAVPAASGGPPPRGILLGTAPGGSVWFVEPPAAVPLNNDMADAKGELAAAEEAVLWRLTGQVGLAAESLETALCAVVWLDAAAARSRYGRWIEGAMPQLIEFPKTGKARGGSKKRGGSGFGVAVEESGVHAAGEEEERSPDVLSTKYIVYLRQLKHPLLLAKHLAAKADFERGGGTSNQPASSNAREQRLPGWRPERRRLSSDLEDEESANMAARNAPPVPIDLLIEASTKAVIITGPNTGGKTATMKALGLAVAAARAGLPVPAAAPALLPCFDAVLADIGDEQSLTASLSTFSGHLRRIEALRKESSGRSLVLLDELGTGTDPAEGAALGIALLRVLSRGGNGGAALSVATTHHSALTALKYDASSSSTSSAPASSPPSASVAGRKNKKESAGGSGFDFTLAALDGSSGRFENASVEFDEARLAPTYRLLWGVPGRSNALNIAERLGLEREVVEAARERLGVAAAAVNDTIIQLEELRKGLDADEAATREAEHAAAAATAKATALR